ncbi:MAG TPA: hypothetical protein PLI09_09170 [Candidatus Hydrogenedentes bacterium]|nr:hypothetical protein [Candidatus Hydrogenedentota bacterium]
MSGLSRKGFGALFGAAVFFALMLVAQHQVDNARNKTFKSELLYLPNAALLQHFTAGMNSIISDLLWIRCVQYIAEENQGERAFKWLDQMLDTVVRLDPYFVDAYRYGGMFLAALKAEDSASLELIERGMVKNPGAWQLPYEAAMIYLLNRQSDPDSQQKAAFYLAMSAATGNAPPLVMDIAAKLQGRMDLFEIERDMWNNLLKSPDTLLRELAARKLQELTLRKACHVLNQRMQQFAQTAGRPAASFDELVQAGLIKAVPPDPLGGRFFIDPDGKVQNTTLLDSIKAQNTQLIRDALSKYREKHGTWPPDLEDLVRKGPFTQLPPNPYKGQTWQYDPKTGEVN